jgi:hypothetical protein
MIAGWVQELGRTKPPAGPEISAVRPSVPETSQAATVAQTAPETRSKIARHLMHLLRVDGGGDGRFRRD